ncbi:MAG: LysR family transcriptional regulator [Pseudomonadota bacterium]
MHNFDWDDIRVFLAIVEHGSLNQAADYLAINQSTVSRRIAALEERLDVSLFERKRGSRWAVTPAGEQMLESAEKMNDFADAISRDVLSNSTDVRGHVTVTFAEVGTRYIAAPALGELAKQYSELSLTLLVDPNPLNLAAREADVAIRIGDVMPDDVLATQICTASVAIYGTPELHERYRNGEEGLPVMTWTVDDKLTQWLQAVMPNTRVMYRSNSSVAITEMASRGACIVPLSCFEGDRAEELERFEEFPIMAGPGLWVISHADLRTTARVRLVRDTLVEQLMKERDQIEVDPNAPRLESAGA